jgi:uncharacterized protein (DUF1330 family)
MAAYIIVDVVIKDAEAYERYRARVPATLAAYGGRFLVRGGVTDTLEGTWSPQRLVVLEFDSIERARAWWSSAEYAEPKRLRQAVSIANIVLVAGV